MSAQHAHVGRQPGAGGNEDHVLFFRYPVEGEQAVGAGGQPHPVAVADYALFVGWFIIPAKTTGPCNLHNARTLLDWIQPLIQHDLLELGCIGLNAAVKTVQAVDRGRSRRGLAQHLPRYQQPCDRTQ